MCVWSVVLSTGDMVRQVEWPGRPSAGPQARVGERGGQSLSTPFVGRGVRPFGDVADKAFANPFLVCSFANFGRDAEHRWQFECGGFARHGGGARGLAAIVLGEFGGGTGTFKQHFVGLCYLWATAHFVLANPLDCCRLGFGLAQRFVDGETARRGVDTHHVAATNFGSLCSEPGAVQHLFRPNGSNLGARKIHPFPWSDRVAELGLAFCPDGVGGVTAAQQHNPY